MGDWLDDLSADSRLEWEKMVDHFRRDAAEKIAGSAAMVSLVPTDGKPDVKFSMELGYGIMLDKPLIIVVQPGQEIPEHLKRVADKIVEVDFDTFDGQQALAEAIKETVGTNASDN